MWDRFLNAVMALLMASAVGVAFLAIIFRYVIEQSLPWSFEVSLALLCYMTFIGAYIAMRRGAHLKVDVLVRRLPLRYQGVAFLGNQIVVGAVGGVMLYWGTVQTVKFASRTTTVLELPLGYLYAIVPLAGAGIIAECIVQTVRGIRRLRRGEQPEQAGDQFSLD